MDMRSVRKGKKKGWSLRRSSTSIIGLSRRTHVSHRDSILYLQTFLIHDLCAVSPTQQSYDRSVSLSDDGSLKPYFAFFSGHPALKTVYQDMREVMKLVLTH